MPFHPSDHHPAKYSSIENQKIHEYEYKNFLKTLQKNRNNSTKSKCSKQHQEIYFNKNYFLERQINLQSRQDKRKHEYERIQKENLKFSQKLIHAKASLNRYEQEKFFDKHCKLKQRLQHYPDFIQNSQTIKSNNYCKISNKSPDSSFLIYNEKKSKQLQEKHSKDFITNINKLQITKKNIPHFIQHHSQFSRTRRDIESTVHNINSLRKISAPSKTRIKII